MIRAVRTAVLPTSGGSASRADPLDPLNRLAPSTGSIRFQCNECPYAGDSDALTLYEHGSALLALSRLPEAIAELQRSVESARAKDDTRVLIRA